MVAHEGVGDVGERGVSNTRERERVIQRKCLGPALDLNLGSRWGGRERDRDRLSS